MSSFTTDLIVRPLDDGRRWELMESFSYDVGHAGSGETITVPKGFITDFASVPRAFWRLFPPCGRYGKAAVIHDYLYRTHEIAGKPITRPRADAIFLEGMKVLGVGFFTRWAMFMAVKAGGWFAWKKSEQKAR